MKEPACAREWFEEALEHFRVLGHEGGEAAALRGLMEASLLASDLETAEAYQATRPEQSSDGSVTGRARRGRSIRTRCSPWPATNPITPQHVRGGPQRLRRKGADYGIYSAYGIFSAVCLLGEALYAQGRYADAVAAYGEAVSIQGRTGFVRDVEDLLEDLAIVAAALGASEQAAELLGAAATWRAIDADPRVPYGMADYRAATAASRRSLGPRAGRPPSTPAPG